MLRIDPVAPHEIEAFCAAPYRPSDPGFDGWLAGERAWVAEHHPTPARLWLCRLEDEVLGKVDVPFDAPRGWTLWAPTVRASPNARAVMDRLLAHVQSVARERCVPSIELILEAGHSSFDVAAASLEEGGWGPPEERAVVQVALTDDLPPSSGALRVTEARTLTPSALRELAEASGVEVGALDEVVQGAASNPLSIVAWRDDVPVGVGLASSGPGDDPLTEEHVGLVPEARGRGWGWPLLLEFLRGGRRAGATAYVGSTSTGNLAMRRIFERAGAKELARRRVYRWHP